jgi:cyclopropane fatty-acyl-phospholipid synthase-like methyltransferase
MKSEAIKGVPTESADFDRAYRAPITLWGDVRIPHELKILAKQGSPRKSLEYGCGLGRFSSYLAKQGINATAVDFSPVAIERARNRVTNEGMKPTFIVGDVTHLGQIKGPFDFSFDIGCFHCLGADAQKAYVTEVSRLLKPDGIHLIWAMDDSPAAIPLSPEKIKEVFAPEFQLYDAKVSRRRIVASHWYWLKPSTN